MATEAQIQANRANAGKSTGPRTEAGKSRSRLNALKHGARAQDGPAVLPQEDPAELQARIQEWTDDYQPSNAIERELVSRAARTSWALDRAERFEAALLSRRVRKAMLRSRARRTAHVCDLARKLLYLAGKRLLPGSGPEWDDDPAAFLAGLEETTEGARWLLDRWTEIRCLILSDQDWTFLDQFKFIRLLGKQPFDAIDDPELNEVFLAWEVIETGWGVRFWKKAQESTPYEDPAFSAWRLWREIVPRPVDAEAAVARLRSIAEREIERLEELLDDLDAIEGDDARELAEQASFSASDASERLRRFQTARTRELIKTVETLSKLRKESVRPEPRPKATPKKAPNEANPNPSEPAIEPGLATRTDAPELPNRTQSETVSASSSSMGRLRILTPSGEDAQAPSPSRRGATARPAPPRGRRLRRAAPRVRPADAPLPCPTPLRRDGLARRSRARPQLSNGPSRSRRHGSRAPPRPWPLDHLGFKAPWHYKWHAANGDMVSHGPVFQGTDADWNPGTLAP